MDSVCELKTAESVAASTGHSAISSQVRPSSEDAAEKAEAADKLADQRVCIRQRSRELLRAQSASDE